MNDIQARRTGLIAEKVGMTQVFQDGKAVAVTLLRIEGNTVVSVKTKKESGYNAVVMGYGAAKSKSLSKSVRGMLEKNGVPYMKILREFRVSSDALLAIGSRLKVSHFMVGQYVDVQGQSIGKGFAGGMKRWNFRGLEASHGVSVSHRSHGSTGQRQDPGKVFKGKKMAGHLGVETVTIQNLKVVIVDEELGLIGVNGSVPGKVGSCVLIQDAIKLALPGEVQFPADLMQNQEEVSQ
jgi:large subunit ribosomal protein L3